MVKLHLTFALVLVFLSHCFLAREKGIFVPNYSIQKTTLNTTLNENEAVFKFTFSRDTNVPVKAKVKIGYNGTTETIQPDDKGRCTLKIKPGKYRLQFFYSSDYYEVTTDSIKIKSKHETEISVRFDSSKFPVICDKPVIYLYPQKTTGVCVSLDVKGKLDFTYPEYNKGWDFMVDANGTIHKGNKEYQYLFWDGETGMDAAKINMKEGFIIDKNNLIVFFEDKLGKMGLNAKETEDFITYWCPRMNANKSNFVHFLFNEEFNQYAGLSIHPKPDNLFRVFMLWAPAGEINTVDIKEQKIESFNRKGFAVIEWGGGEIKNNQNKL